MGAGGTLCRHVLRRLLRLAVLALALPAAASAAPLVGIAENNPQVFADPLFEALHVRTTRLVVSWNVAVSRTNEYGDRVVPYLDAARAQGLPVLVTLEHARGNAAACRQYPTHPQCLLPTVAQYRDALYALLWARPDIHLIAPWNEANHPSQPTATRPGRAARFANAAAAVCRELRRHCTIVAADVLDQADDPAAAQPVYTGTRHWIRRYRRALHVRRRVCGIHDYSDVNRFRSRGLRVLTRTLHCRRYWITEGGGLYRFGSFWTAPTKAAGHCDSAAACQLAATRFLFAEVARHPRIRRVYVYTWYGPTGRYMDAGIVHGAPGGPTVARPAYWAVAQAIRGR
jgi:hypothetical protein